MKIFPLFLLVCFGCVCSGLADSKVAVTDGWVRAVPPASTGTAAYFVVKNETGEALRLVGAESALAEKLAPMITTHKVVEGQPVVGMDLAPFLEVPAHGKRVLEPGGDHLMIMGLKQPVRAGEKVALTLIFEPGPIRVDVVWPVSKGQPGQ